MRRMFLQSISASFFRNIWDAETKDESIAIVEIYLKINDV